MSRADSTRRALRRAGRRLVCEDRAGEYLAACLSRYHRGNTMHSVDALWLALAGGPDVRQRHPGVMDHLRSLDAGRLP